MTFSKLQKSKTLTLRDNWGYLLFRSTFFRFVTRVLVKIVDWVNFVRGRGGGSYFSI